jgi:hypothetical protein
MDDASDDEGWRPTDWSQVAAMTWSSISAGLSDKQVIDVVWKQMQEANPVLRPMKLPPGVWCYGGYATKASGSGERGVSGSTKPAPMQFIFMFAAVLLLILWMEERERTGMHVPFEVTAGDVGSTSRTRDIDGHRVGRLIDNFVGGCSSSRD